MGGAGAEPAFGVWPFLGIVFALMANPRRVPRCKPSSPCQVLLPTQYLGPAAVTAPSWVVKVFSTLLEPF